VCNWLFTQVIATARNLGPQQVDADAVMGRWLWHSDTLDLETFLANDDVRTGYHLMRWMEQGPPPLAELCGRLLQRRLLKATDVGNLASGERLELLALAQRLSAAAGLAPEHHCTLLARQSRGYDPYKGGLRLWNGERLQALEQRSPLVQSLTHTTELVWLIHPADVSDALRLRLAELLPPGA
jgi:hypothetical protein